MKKNAVLIAGIMFVAGGAAAQAGPGFSYDRSSSDRPDARDFTIRSTENIDRSAQGLPGSPMEVATASQYDPASNVNRFHADSSIRGGSNESRGLRQYNHSSDHASRSPMNPAVQADSSIRGGSWQARNRNSSGVWQSTTGGAVSKRDQHVSADSSIRGGSSEARGWGRDFEGAQGISGNAQSGSDLSVNMDADSSLNHERNSSMSFDSGTAANWNSTDDLLDDGTQLSPSQISAQDAELQANQNGSSIDKYGVETSDLQRTDDMDSDASSGIGGSATFESGSSSSSSSECPPGAELNSSSHLEQDISGEYSLNDQIDSSRSQASSGPDLRSGSEYGQSEYSNSTADVSSSDSSAQGSGISSDSSEAVGGPGSTEVGSSNSGAEQASHPAITADQPQLSPSEGVSKAESSPALQSGGQGSAPAAEQGQGSDLSQKVKATLTKESTGTFGITAAEARNIQVTSHGGLVTLKGSVSSERNKKMVEVRAAEIEGVTRVDNQLTVSPNAMPAVRDVNGSRNLEDATGDWQD